MGRTFTRATLVQNLVWLARFRVSGGRLCIDQIKMDGMDHVTGGMDHSYGSTCPDMAPWTVLRAGGRSHAMASLLLATLVALCLKK